MSKFLISERENFGVQQVPKEKIIYVAYVLNSTVETPVMVPGLWMLMIYDGKKVYVPKSGT